MKSGIFIEEINPEAIPIFKKGIRNNIIKASAIFLNLKTSIDFLKDMDNTSFISTFFS